MIYHVDAYLIDGTIKEVVLSQKSISEALVMLDDKGRVDLNGKHGSITAVGLLIKGRDFAGRGF